MANYIYLSTTENSKEKLELLETLESRKSAVAYIKTHCDELMKELDYCIEPTFFGNEYCGGFGYKIIIGLNKYTVFFSNGRVYR